VSTRHGAGSGLRRGGAGSAKVLLRHLRPRVGGDVHLGAALAALPARFAEPDPIVSVLW
jgi:hypothetical protein